MPVSESADRRFDAAVAGNDDAQRLHVAEAGRGGEHAQLLAFLDAALAAAGAEHGKNILDLVGRGAEFAQDRADGLALLDDDEVLAPLACCPLVLGRSVMFSGTTRASKPI